jgi:uncharacterized membrane protein
MSVLTTIARGDASRVSDARRVLASTPAEWSTLWAVHAGPDTAAPAVDFAAVTIAAAFAGEKPSAGYSLEITRAEPIAEGVRLIVDEHAPGPGTVAAQIITSPFHIVSMPRVAGRVSWAGEARDAMGEGGGTEIEETQSTLDARRSDIDDGQSRVATDAPSSSTGLDPRTASALAYLAGPFSGALMLFAESTSDLVRFHAWQSIVALGGLGLAVIISYVLAFAALFISATAVSVMVAVATVIWIVLAIVWVLCLWKALSGERWKLPLAGDYAERLI